MNFLSAKSLLFDKRGAIPVLIILTFFTASATDSHAGQIWDGGAGSGLWNNALNWDADTLPNFGSAISFAGVTQTATINDLAVDTTIGGISFANTTADQAFTLSGNRITLGGNITTATLTGGVASATIHNTINLDIILSGSRTITTAASTTHGNHNLTINGIISENSAGLGLTKNGGSGGILTLSALNTFSGPVTLVSGTLSFNTIADAGVASALGMGSTIVAGSSLGSTGTLLYTGGGDSTNRQIQIGTGTVTSTVGLIIQNNGAGALSFTNSDFNIPFATSTATKTLTLSGSNTGANHITGVIADNNSAGGGMIALTKSGSGTWVLSGLNSFSGQVRIDQGTLSVNSLANTGTSSAIGTGSGSGLINIGSVSSTGTLIYTGSADVSTNRQVQIGRSTTNVGGAVIQNDGTGTMSFSNAVFNTSDTTITSTSAARTLTLQGTNAGNNVISGVISNNVGSGAVVGAVSLTKAGSGMWTLAGANTFTGNVSLSAGTLNLNNAGSGGTSSAIGTGTLTITGGGIDNTSGGAITLSTNNPVAFNGNFVFGATEDLNLGSGVVSIGGSSRTLTFNGVKTLTMGELRWSSDLDRTLTVTQGSGAGGKLVLGGFQLNTLSTATGSRTRTIAGGVAVEITGAVVDGNGFANNLTYSGNSILKLSAANSYTGITSITGGGVLDVGDLSSGSLVDGGLVFSSSSVLQGSGIFTRDFSGTATAAVGQLAGSTGGFAARGGAMTVNFGGAADTVLMSAGQSRFGTNFVFGSPTADSPVIVVNPLSTNGTFIRTFTVNSGMGGDYAELQGAVTNTGSLVKEGAGLLILSGDNTVSGSLTINAGIVQFGNPTTNGGTTGAVPFSSIINNAGVVLNRSNALTYANVISGTGNLTQAGAGTTILTGTSTYLGATIISAGTLQLGSGGTAGAITGTSGITNNATLAVSRSNALTISSNISGSGVVSQIGTGVTSLGGVNTYGGGTNINLGVLSFLNTNAKPAAGVTTVAAGATIGLGVAAADGFFKSADVDGLFAGTLADVINDAASNVGIDTTAGDFTYASNVPATTRGLNKLGPNTLTLTGSNAYTGNTIISEGVLDVGTISGGALGSGGLSFANGGILQGNGSFTRSFSGNSGAASGQLSGLSGGFAAKGGMLTINFGGAGAAVTMSNGNFRFGNNFVFGSPTADSRVVVVNPLALNTLSRTFTVNAGAGGDSAELQGVISSGSATDGIIKAGAGLLILSGNSTYTGATTISNGTLQLGNGGTAGSINNTSGITNNGTFAFNRSNALVVPSGISGTGVVNQIGTGTTTLSGSNNYSGGTNVNSGILTYLNTNAKPGTGITTVAAGATLGLGVATAGSFFTSADVDSLFAGTLADVIHDATSRVGIDTTAGDFNYATSIAATTRGLTKLGNNTLSLSGTNAYTGVTTVAGGILSLESAGALPGGIGSTGGTSNLTLAGGVIGLTPDSGDFRRGIGSGVSQVRWVTDTVSGFAAFDGDRNVNFGGAGSVVTWSNGTGVIGNGLILSDSTSDSTITVVNPLALNFLAGSRVITVNDGLPEVDAIMAGVLSSQITAGNGTRIVKNGAGTLALTAANTYVSGTATAGTTISAGTLMLGNGGSTGSISALTGIGISSVVSISSGAIFAFNRSDTGLVVANTIVGAGAVRQLGSGTTTMSGDNSYSGGTAVTAGTLLVTNTTGSATGTGGVSTAAGTTLGGTGTIAPTGANSVILGGSVAPGVSGSNNGIGKITFTPADGGVTFQSTSSIAFQLGGDGVNDSIDFNSLGSGVLDFTAMLAGSWGVSFASGYTPAAGHSFDLIDWAAISGPAVSGLSESLLGPLPTVGFDPSWIWNVSQFITSGTISIAIIPEPSRVMLMLTGMLLLILRRRCR
jgi:fibronectin-binding autotransporter adhesin